MAQPRFFCPIPLSLGETVDLPPSVANHAGRALRLREGTEIVLFNGVVGQYHAYLCFHQGQAQAELFHFDPINRQLKGEITLVQALASGDKMDWIIEKAVEIGVHRLIPIQAERSILNLQGSRLAKRQQHWQAIAQAACEQSGRNQLLQLEPVQTLANGLKQLNPTHQYLCDPDAIHSLLEQLQTAEHCQALSLCIGPEGGWSEKEVALMQKHGAMGVRFGERVLRTETAGLALASASAAVLNWF